MANRQVDTPVLRYQSDANSLVGTNWILRDAFGGGLQWVTKSELVTIAASATTNSSIRFPVGTKFCSVATRVVVAVPDASTFGMKISEGQGDQVSVPGTLDITLNATSAALITTANISTNGLITITPNETPSDNTGRIRLTISYLIVIPPDI